MNRVEKLNEELKRRGAEFTVREHEKWVNGVYYKGLMLWSRQNNINPIIYDAEILTDAKIDTAVDKLIHFHEMTAEPPIEYEEMMNPDWFRKHLTIRLYSSRAKSISQRNKSFIGIVWTWQWHFMYSFRVLMSTANVGRLFTMMC